MIISASRRTDIPAFYAPWFLNRLREGHVLVPNPFDPRSVSRVSLRPDAVDCIVFWTKNPAPMLPRLGELNGFKYYFQFTLNPYGKDIERNLPSIEERIETFRKLSEMIGKERVVWRYDPILINETYDTRFHREAFTRLARKLSNHTERCMLGFIDRYRHIRPALDRQDIRPPERGEIESMAASFRCAVADSPIRLETCTVKIDLSHAGIPGGPCIDKDLIERIAGYRITAIKDRNQRKTCRCIESIDIGMYDSCPNGCTYCYATRSKENAVANNFLRHNPDSPTMIGEPCEDSVIRDRPAHSLRNGKHSLF